MALGQRGRGAWGHGGMAQSVGSANGRLGRPKVRLGRPKVRLGRQTVGGHRGVGPASIE